MKYKSLLCMSALIAVLGCEEEKDAIVSSDGISTEQMYASIELVSAGNNQVIGNTQLTVLSPPRDNKSGDEYIELSASDRLWKKIASGSSRTGSSARCRSRQL